MGAHFITTILSLKFTLIHTERVAVLVSYMRCQTKLPNIPLWSFRKYGVYINLSTIILYIDMKKLEAHSIPLISGYVLQSLIPINLK